MQKTLALMDELIAMGNGIHSQVSMQLIIEEREGSSRVEPRPSDNYFWASLIFGGILSILVSKKLGRQKLSLVKAKNVTYVSK